MGLGVFMVFVQNTLAVLGGHGDCCCFQNN